MKKLKQYDWLDISFWAAVFILAFMFGCSITGCASAKSKHSEYQKTDSTSTVKEEKTTEVKADSFAVRKSQTIQATKIDSSTANEHTVITEETTTKEFDSAGKVVKETITKKKTDTKKDSKGGSYAFTEDHSKLDSSGWNKDSKAVEKKGTETNVTNTVKISDKAKYSFNLLWLLWLLLIPVACWAYKNRSNIKSWIIKKATGIGIIG